MGSYNRGYDPGIKGLSDSVDTHLGNAVIKQAMGDEIAMAAGFYALAYKWGDQTVISYHGTDSFDLSNPANDVLNGWLAGIGKKTSQVDLALAFPA